LKTKDGWLAVALAREDDIDAVPAWLEIDAPSDDDPWNVVAEVAAERDTRSLEARGALLGLPIASLPHEPPPPMMGSGPFGELPVGAEAFGEHKRERGHDTETMTVVDLSSLWAGPLCGHLLHLAGAHVIKVESRARPDGARRGPEPFFDLLNDGKASVALDLDKPDGIDALRRLVASADVVIEGSRPRALAQLGVIAEDALRASDGPCIWISITGHGRTGDAANRVAFGDDAAVAGGLVVWDDNGPCFCADAIADPLTGIVAATAALVGLGSERRWLVDISMAGVAAAFAGPTLETTGHEVVAPPSARRPRGKASPLGRETAAVLRALDAAQVPSGGSDSSSTI
jgi:crotonobetainyl-CoA:carnitine CoA-transferase CaiB-like acyl-CoA transferase